MEQVVAMTRLSLISCRIRPSFRLLPPTEKAQACHSREGIKITGLDAGSKLVGVNHSVQMKRKFLATLILSHGTDPVLDIR